MTAQEAFTQPPPSAGGVDVRLFQLTRSDGTVVYVQAISIVDATNPAGIAPVDAALGLSVNVTRDVVTQVANVLQMNALRRAVAGTDGFAPLEIPEFLAGV
jgi:hypothetical protein